MIILIEQKEKLRGSFAPSVEFGLAEFWGIWGAEGHGVFMGAGG